MPAYVNVVFPLKQRLLQTQLKALNYVSEELQKMPHPPHDGNLADIGDQVLSQVASHILEESTTISQDQNYGSNPWIRKILFPDCADGVLQTSLRSYPSRGFFDSVLNYEQAHAVDAICENKFGVLPYLISGPPGTGKTKTLVEAAMQLLNTTSVAHVLICAPSEPAADTIAIRLKAYLPPGKLLRLNSPGRSHIEVPQELMQYTYTEKDMFYLPPFQQLMAYNIVVTSCRDASILVDARLTNADLWSIEKNMLAAFHPESSLSPPPLHWGALLLDEAAQATEVDVLPALSVIMPPSSFPQDLDQPRLAMAGDDNQLGPRIASQDSLFSTSLFARLFERPLFKNHPLSRSNVRPSVGPPVLKKEMLPILYAPFTNLVRNYRSHPAILSVPSNLFYNDTLIPEAAIPSTPLQASPLWQGRKWPVLFIPHTGADEIERDGGGWYNHSEAKLACDTAQHLWAECGVAPATICIMSPFAAQVKQLRALMRSAAYGRAGAGLWDVNIGPLEAFQGLEKRVVIICTTRTRSRFLRKDAERGLGLVHQRRKMNVAVTRAMEALVVIGSPLVLRQDEHWSAFLAFCARNGLVGQGALAGDGDAWRLDGLALLVREEREKLAAAGQRGRALGSGAASLEEVDGGLYEEWIENLKAALEDEEDGGDDGDDVEEEVGQGEEDEEQEDQGGVAG
ncbi:P-loop containing nucleoside triphosphate hydrolase protein [Massariosphaeria phaeospora]|uniref:P-loop containing nucleoside triphosphate hydrolase protein n=1 Tax=Massariosphaeria phaeospora TaxID=100035 RepID=A0A7C8MCQ4_9PLEO|nr:P-loop containing nucleoside triphosphate hydrolase protein [Massariosphaeria phaeospora]